MSRLEESNFPAFTCLYFGFASNLSPRCLQGRCPGSLFVGLAILKGWKFIITSTGFGNIVISGDEKDVVYGALHFLTAQHEAALDKSEEVPGWHQKVKLKVRRVNTLEGESAETPQGEEIEVLTYVDVERTTAGVVSKEYIPFMRIAIEDGLKIGVPEAYMEKSLKIWLPEDESVGKEETITMMRTVQMNKEEMGYVPRDLQRLAETK